MSRVRAKIGKILFTRKEIETRLDELAGEIQERYARCQLTVVAVLKGSLFFTADLVRRLEMPVRVDILEVSSYFDGSSPGEEMVLSNYLVQDVKGRHVLVVDDIVDTGGTLAGVCELLSREKPKSLATCVFLNKRRKRRVDVPIDFSGFEVKARDFVVGYGLDFAQRFRNLPYIAALEKAEKPAGRGKAAAGKTKKRQGSPKKKRSSRKKARPGKRTSPHRKTGGIS